MSTDGRRQRTAVSRAAILDAAERLFAEGGYTSTSLRTIASAIGMSHAGVLKHFASKGDLLLAVLERLEPGRDVVELVGTPGLEKPELLRQLLVHTTAQAAALTLRVVLLGEATDEAHPAHSFVRERLELVEADLGAALGADGADLLAAWNGLQLVRRYVPSLDTVALAVAHVAPASSDPLSPIAITSASPRPAPLPVDQTREERIVSVASRAFARAGYRASSLRDIAMDLDLSHSALLYHFPTKVQLLEAVLDARDRDESLPWSLGGGPLDYLNGMYLQALHNESEPAMAELFSTLVSEATDPLHPAHRYFAERYLRFHAELQEVLVELVEEGLARADVDPSAEAWVLIARWEGLALRSFYLPDEVGLPERLRASINSLLTVRISAI